TGATAYPRVFDFPRLRKIADDVEALLLVDMAHFAGLVAAGEHPTPVGYAKIVTTTTHKTLRGPRGGMILCDADHAKAIDSAVFPNVQGGPLMHVIAGKAVMLKEAATPEFKAYAKQIRTNARTLAASLAKAGLRLVSGGTDNHLMLVDVRPLGLTGKVAEKALDAVGITVNKNTIPYDPNKPAIASGIRIGTPAVTTRGMRDAEMERIGALIGRILQATAEMPTEPRTVDTPLAPYAGARLAEKVGLIPVLRAGIGMVEAALELMPDAQVWHIGLFRDERTLRPIEYYNKLPSSATVQVCLVLDPMLATGGSATATVHILKRWGAKRIKYVGIIAAPEGV